MDITQTPIGRISWPAVFGDGEEENGTKKYKITLMLPKNHAAFKGIIPKPRQLKLLKEVKKFVTELRRQSEALAKAQWKKNYKNTRYDPVIDGDDESWEGYHNFWIIRPKSTFKPTITSPKKGKLIVEGDEDEVTGFYPGCWARGVITLYSYSNANGKGVSLGLGNIQKAWNDETFQTGGHEWEDDIEDMDVDESDRDEFDDAEGSDDFEDAEASDEF